MKARAKPQSAPKKRVVKKASTRQADGSKRSAARKTAKGRPEGAAAEKKVPASADAIFQKIRTLCLALPDTKLTMTWGSPHFRVGEKIFCGFGAEDGKPVMGVKLERGHAQQAVKEARFWPAAYVGKYGWVSMDVSRRKGWDEVASLIRESYGLIAPKASLAKLR